MRVVDIPRFPRQIKDIDLEVFLTTRLSGTVVMWPDQAIPLLGYMCRPNEDPAREALMEILHGWPGHSESGSAPLPDNLAQIQSDWLKVADIFHLYCDLIGGGHQERRGGPSIGKAITLVAANAESRGTGAANLWKLWSAYKDVAHLVTAVSLICGEVWTRFGDRPPAPGGLSPTQFTPFQMALLMPDLVLSVAMGFQSLGLRAVSDARTEPALDPATVWRIPAQINVVPLPPPMRKLRPQDIVVLGQRRAGNRGRANKTTPVSG